MPAKKVTAPEVPPSPFEGLTVRELMILRTDALFEESEAKRFLVLLRQRAANMPSTAGVDVEEEIISAKKEHAKAVEHLQAVEKALEGEFKDITAVHKF